MHTLKETANLERKFRDNFLAGTLNKTYDPRNIRNEEEFIDIEGKKFEKDFPTSNHKSSNDFPSQLTHPEINEERENPSLFDMEKLKHDNQSISFGDSRLFEIQATPNWISEMKNELEKKNNDNSPNIPSLVGEKIDFVKNQNFIESNSKEICRKDEYPFHDIQDEKIQTCKQFISKDTGYIENTRKIKSKSNLNVNIHPKENKVYINNLSTVSPSNLGKRTSEKVPGLILYNEFSNYADRLNDSLKDKPSEQEEISKFKNEGPFLFDHRDQIQIKNLLSSDFSNNFNIPEKNLYIDQINNNIHHYDSKKENYKLNNKEKNSLFVNNTNDPSEKCNNKGKLN